MAFLETVGLEIEGSGLSREAVAELLNRRFPGWNEYFSVGKDASVESISKSISPYISIINHDNLSQRCESRLGVYTTGYEITTIPLYFDRAEYVVRKIINALVSRGEIQSPRASTHIHVGYADSFQLMKSAFTIGLWLEPLFYKLAGMGNIYRGCINNSIYARPLELSVAVPAIDHNYYSLLNVESALKADSTESLWKHYGISISQYKLRPERYHPARYFGFNLLAIPIHGTLEFRFFNSSLNANWILAITRFCQAVTELATKVSRSWVDNLSSHLVSGERKSITEGYSDYELHNMLDMVEYNFDKHDLNFNTSSIHKRILREIIEKTPNPQFTNAIPKSHIKTFLLREQLVWGLFKKVDNPIESGYTDIHNISTSFSSIISSEE